MAMRKVFYGPEGIMLKRCPGSDNVCILVRISMVFLIKIFCSRCIMLGAGITFLMKSWNACVMIFLCSCYGYGNLPYDQGNGRRLV